MPFCVAVARAAIACAVTVGTIEREEMSSSAKGRSRGNTTERRVLLLLRSTSLNATIEFSVVQETLLKLKRAKIVTGSRPIPNLLWASSSKLGRELPIVAFFVVVP